MEFIKDLLAANPYFSAGFGLLGVGAGFATARQGFTRLMYLAQRRYLTTIEVTSKDPAYGWLNLWLGRQALSSGNHFSLSSTYGKASGDQSVCGATLSPSPGVHYFRWRGSWLQVRRERDRTALMDLSTGMPFETTTLTMIGRRPQLFLSLIEEARTLAARQEQGKLMIFTAWANEWRPFGLGKRKRTLDSVVFAPGIKEALLADVREFLQSNQWYLERGIPYRRGYLLYGPPGGGKSSFVQALASELNYGICLLNLSDHIITDDRLNHLFNALPERTILLLEDVDGAIHQSSPPATSPQSGGKLTFSGLLNAIDGVASSEERIIFMTTNHRERLDEALIRPGRIDYQQYIGRATPEQMRTMFMRFYPDASLNLVQSFLHALSEVQVSPASIQGHFIQFKNNPKDAIDNIDLIRNK